MTFPGRKILFVIPRSSLNRGSLKRDSTVMKLQLEYFSLMRAVWEKGVLYPGANIRGPRGFIVGVLYLSVCPGFLSVVLYRESYIQGPYNRGFISGFLYPGSHNQHTFCYSRGYHVCVKILVHVDVVLCTDLLVGVMNCLSNRYDISAPQPRGCDVRLSDKKET